MDANTNEDTSLGFVCFLNLRLLGALAFSPIRELGAADEIPTSIPRFALCPLRQSAVMLFPFFSCLKLVD
jgi:hypothetical protein